MSVVPVIAAGTFYPKSLFSNSEQGVWYDPSDLSTMYEDSAGTTAVHTPGNGTADSPVGKILDKSGNGNHATQSTSTARPTLSARYNLLTYSEALDNAAWTKTNMTATDGATDPNGGSTAETLVASAANGTVTQSFTAVATDYTFSVYLKRKTGTGNIDISCNSGGTWVTKTITSSWAQYSVTQTLTAGSKTPGIRIVTSGDEVYAWGADLRVSNDGVGLPAYQRIADANTYDSTGFPYYLKLDGVDDRIFCSAFSFNSSKTLSGWFAVRQLSSQINKDYFCGDWHTGTTGRWVMYIDGSSQINIQVNCGASANAASSGSVVGLTKIASFNSDATAPSLSLRLNGAAAGSSTASQGSGSFVTQPVFLGDDTVSTYVPNIRIYGAILRVASSTASEIANTETWLNTKTKAY